MRNSTLDTLSVATYGISEWICPIGRFINPKMKIWIGDLEIWHEITQGKVYGGRREQALRKNSKSNSRQTRNTPAEESVKEQAE